MSNLIKQLIEIANILDNSGLYREASEIDEILKYISKKADDPQRQINFSNEESEPFYPQSRDISFRDEESDVIKPMTEEEKKNDMLARIDKIKSKVDTGTAALEKKKKMTKILNWQKKYNNVIGNSGAKKLLEDGIWGRNTADAYKLVKQVGWDGLKNIVNKKIERSKEEQANTEVKPMENVMQDKSRLDVTKPGYGGSMAASEIRQSLINSGISPAKIPDPNTIMKLLQSGHSKEDVIGYLKSKIQ